MKTGMIFWIALCLLGCAPIQTRVKRIPFPQDEYEQLAKDGTGIVTGQAFLKTVGGDVKYAAGNQVFLIPVTSYSRQWYNVLCTQRQLIEGSDWRHDQYIKKQIADAEGRFTFVDIPAGSYYVSSLVLWAAPTPPYGYLGSQGGVVVRCIEVKEGATTQAMVTQYCGPLR